jgi:hypothetical protein
VIGVKQSSCLHLQEVLTRVDVDDQCIAISDSIIGIGYQGLSSDIVYKKMIGEVVPKA